MASVGFVGDNVAHDEGSAADWAGDPIAWTEGKGDAGFDDWKLEVLGTTAEDGKIADCCEEVVEATAASVWLPWPTDISEEETEERREGKKVSQFM